MYRRNVSVIHTARNLSEKQRMVNIKKSREVWIPRVEWLNFTRLQSTFVAW